MLSVSLRFFLLIKASGHVVCGEDEREEEEGKIKMLHRHHSAVKREGLSVFFIPVIPSPLIQN